MRILPILALCVPLLTGGCFVGDGVAHVVKLANKASSDDGNTPPQPAAAPAQPVQPAPSAAPVDRDPAPMPATAPVTDIRVEELPPPK